MTIGELRKAFDSYPADAKIQIGVSIPDLYINSVANLSIVGDRPEPGACEVVRFIATLPSRHANPNTQGTVQEG